MEAEPAEAQSSTTEVKKKKKKKVVKKKKKKEEEEVVKPEVVSFLKNLVSATTITGLCSLHDMLCPLDQAGGGAHRASVSSG